MQPTVSRKIARHVLIGTSSYPLFSVCNPIAERQLSVADYYMLDDGYWPVSDLAADPRRLHLGLFRHF
jgi:hypothetical protein